MLRSTVIKSAKQAVSYFVKELSTGEYYSKDGLVTSLLCGRLAKRLGLEGIEVTPEIYRMLVQNRLPDGGKLTPRDKANRRIGYDFTLSCPKSVSLVYGMTRDENIKKAFDEAVNKTMQQMEKDVGVRVRKNGKNELRNSGEFMWTAFTHETARPTENGVISDPHLHKHCIAFNATWDPVEQKVKAFDVSPIKRKGDYYEAVFHNNLAHEIIKAGYKIRPTKKGFHLAGISDELVQKFSKRTKQINKAAKEKGITDKNAKAELGRKTRGAKDQNVTIRDLQKSWDEQMTIEELQSVADVKTHAGYLKPTTAKDAISYAVTHLTERASVVSREKIEKTAILYGIGQVEEQDIRKALNSDKSIKQLKDNDKIWCTTDEAIKEEKKLLKQVNQGCNKYRPFGLGQKHKLKREFLNAGQKDAVHHVLESKDQVILIRGGAGTGKTTMMSETIEAIEKKNDKKVFCFAPTSAAAKDVLAKEGFEAETIAKLTYNKSLQEKLKNQVIWVDEAGLVGIKDMNKIMDIASQQNARIVLSGDTKQHHAVQRGDALRLIERKSNIKTVEMLYVMRQKDPAYRNAVEQISRGNIDTAFKKLDEMGAIEHMPESNEELHQKLSEDYLDSLRQGKTALIISPTHKEGDLVTQVIRKRLKEKQLLKGDENSFKRFKDKSLTEAEKSNLSKYEEGNVLKFFKHAPGIVAGEALEVVGTDKDKLVVKGEDNRKIKIDIDKYAERFSVYDQDSFTLQKGDKIKINRNGWAKNKRRVSNSNIYEVEGFSRKGNIKLTNGLELDKDFGNIDYGYCITSYASQGKTVDDVYISASAESFAATNAKQFYVSVSRGKQSVKIYTKDKEELLENVIQSGERMTASELTEKIGFRETLENMRTQDFYKQQEKDIDEKQLDNNGREREFELEL